MKRTELLWLAVMICTPFLLLAAPPIWLQDNEGRRYEVAEVSGDDEAGYAVRATWEPSEPPVDPPVPPGVISDTVALQAAIDASQPGDVLLLENGVTFNQVEFSGRHYDITLRPADPEGLPATITGTGGDKSAVRVIGPAVGLTFENLRITNSNPEGTRTTFRCVSLGRDEADDRVTSYDQLPANITFRGCRIGGDLAADNTYYGIMGDCVNMLVEDCVIDGITQGTAEVKGILLSNTPGPVTIRNTRIDTAGIGILCGGSRPAIEGNELLTAGLLIEGCTITHPIQWAGEHGHGIKNCVEIKHGWSAVIRNNIIGPHWQDAQSGAAIVLTPKTNSTETHTPQVYVGDVTIERNQFIDCDSVLRISNFDGVALGPTRGTGRVVFRENVATGTGRLGSNGRQIHLALSNNQYPIGSIEIVDNNMSHAGNWADLSSCFLYLEADPEDRPGVRFLRLRDNTGTPGQGFVRGASGATIEDTSIRWDVGGNTELTNQE